MELYDKLGTYRFFSLFRQLSDIPRETGNEQAASDYIVRFAKQNGLEVHRDRANNVIVRKPAAPGYEGAAPVMLQAHLDMVCEKRPDSPHNFRTDPIAFVVRDDFLMADNTTLGADDGFGVAYMLAVLEDKTMPHPAIEAVFTTDEEVGMGGMQALDVSTIAARRLINLDSEEEGVLCASCAGGIRYGIHLPVNRVAAAPGSVPHRLAVEGLCGGHSGMDIGRERANSILLLARVLGALRRDMPLALSSLDGGAKTNAIPREAYATLWLRPADRPALRERLDEIARVCMAEYAITEPRLSITCKECTAPPATVLDTASLGRVLDALRLLPNGVFSLNPLLPGVLDSSSNLGIAALREADLFLSGLIRSNTNSKITDLADKLTSFTDILGATLETGNAYPAWEYRAQSDLRALCSEVYRQTCGREMAVATTHGGLECGLLAEKIPEMDMVSIGPNVVDAHTPQERIDMHSFIRVWEYLTVLLQNMRS